MKKLAFVLLVLANRVAFSQTFQPNDWVVDGYVFTIAPHPTENKVFIGGDFHYIGPVIAQENAAAVDAVTGANNPALPVVDGNVYVVIPDGIGGWFIGGDFLQVGSLARNSLAHISASGTVLPFNPNPTNGGIEGDIIALALSGDTLFVGGSFDEIGGQFRNYFAAVSASTGDALDWQVSVDAEVDGIVVSETRVFITGGFSDVGGETIAGLAEIDRVTMIPDVDFPTTNGTVNDIELEGSTLYIGGSFTTVGSSARQNLASIDYVTNAVTTWNPSANSDVYALMVHGNSLYVGGVFSTIAGENRSGCVEFTLDNSELTGWYPYGYNCTIAFAVNDIAFANGSVYLGGGLIAFVPGIRGLAAFDSATGALTNWHPGASLPGTAPIINILSLSGSQVYVAGIFTSIGGKAREKLAEIDIASGEATEWSAGFVSGSISALATLGSTLFVGGGYTAIGCLTNREGLAALDVATGAVTSWQADIQSGTTIDAMKISGSTLFVAGSFNSVGGQPRNKLAAINTTTAFVESWNPNPTGSGFVGINSMEIIGSTVYLGGFFSSIGGASRSYLAAVNATTGLATSFDASPSNAGFVYMGALEASPSGNSLYVGGNFTQISGQSRRGVCEYDLSGPSPTLTSWNPGVNGIVLGLLATPSTVYIAGGIDTVGTVRRRGMGLVTTSGTVLPFNPDFSSSNVEVIEAAGLSVFAGGYSDSVFALYHRGMARFTDAALPIQLGSFSATLNQQLRVVLNWMTISEINNYGFFVHRKREGETAWLEIPNSFIPGHGTTNEPHHYTFTDTTTMTGRWHYRLKQIDLDGTINFTEPVTVDILTSAVGESFPIEFAMEQNYPNPFNPTTEIRFQIPEVGGQRSEVSRVTLKVFDLLGREVATLVNENLNAGSYTVTFNAENFATGVYYYRLQAGNDVKSKRMVLIK